MSNTICQEASGDPRVRLDAHSTEILHWLRTHKYRVANPVDIEFRQPNDRYPYERAMVRLVSNNYARVCRAQDGDFEVDVLWLLKKEGKS